jgi:molybdopterin converting factor small subunit
MTGPLVTVEFFGIPRQRAGRKELRVAARTAREALAAVEAAYPSVGELCRADGRLAPHYLLSRDGERFITDLSEPLRAGEQLVLLSADAGG